MRKEIIFFFLCINTKPTRRCKIKKKIAFSVILKMNKNFLISARGKTLDATQEIVALGVCNIIGSFFRSFPVNGSFTRSAVSDASGVRTPAAGLYTSMFIYK